MDDALTPPAWVRKRDGRLEPFDADKISRALFAASESLGRPDAFLARELTDGVVHFLTEEADGAPTAIQIAELVAKVVRELGQPALAVAFTEHGLRRERGPRPAPATADAPQAPGRAAGAPLDEVLSDCARRWTLQTVFARDLAAAHADGLLTLTGLEAPGELAGCVLGPPGEEGLLAAVERARRFAGDFLVLDGPEHLPSLQEDEGRIAVFARDLTLALRLTRLRAVVNLNGAAPPSWAGDLADGPLFPGRPSPPAPDRLARLADGLLAALLHPEAEIGRVRINWHLSEPDFRPEAADRLKSVAHSTLNGSAIGFVFDRPRRDVRLAVGVDRRHPAALLTVGLHLPRLAEQPGVDGDPARFVKKLGSLARLALSAGVQKRDFLRRREASGAPPVTSGFLLDRARLVAAPVGLDSVVQRFTGRGICSGGASLDFGKQIVQTLRDVLRQDGGQSRLATCLDGPDEFHLGGEALTVGQAAGLTPWESSASMKNQLRAVEALHSAAEGGTAALFLSEDPRPTAEAVADWLRTAWKQADVSRVRFRPAPLPTA